MLLISKIYQLLILLISKFNTKKELGKNVFHLFIYQGANYVIPLIAFPYLVRTLGPSQFGVLIFAQAFAQYFIVLTDYGFNLTATQNISKNRDNIVVLREIFGSVLSVKILLLIISAIIFFSTILFIGKFSLNKWIYFYTFLNVIGGVIFPLWVFQGLEKMNYISYLIIIPKLIFTSLIFFIVKTPGDILKAVFLQNISGIISGIIALCVISIRFNIYFSMPSCKSVTNSIKDGFDVFLSGVAINVYTITNTFVLGIFANTTAVGLYGAGEKVIRVVLALFSPISTALFPHIGSLVAKSKLLALLFLKKVFSILFIISFFTSISIFLFAPQINKIFLGNGFTEATIIIRILSPLPFLMTISNICGVQIMLNFDMKKEFRKILTIASVLSLTLIFPLTFLLEMHGTAITWLIVELFVSFSMVYVLRKSNLLNYKNGL